MRKGWRAAAQEWIIIADSNVLMPRDYIQRLFANWSEDTGLVASPPVGCRPEGFWAELECAFLNTYQARWQYLVDTLGHGFAQGKTMLWRRADLDRAGGIEALAKEVAEDAAATKVVRNAGLRGAVDRPAAGAAARTAQRRRSMAPAIALGAIAACQFSDPFPAGDSVGRHPADDRRRLFGARFALPVALCAAGFAALWYGGEMMLAAAAGWHVTMLYPVYGLTRDLLLPVLFVRALQGNDFVWRGNEMQVERMRPRRVMARMRPRVQEVAVGSRRRLRSFREDCRSAEV